MVYIESNRSVGMRNGLTAGNESFNTIHLQSTYVYDGAYDGFASVSPQNIPRIS